MISGDRDAEDGGRTQAQGWETVHLEWKARFQNIEQLELNSKAPVTGMAALLQFPSLTSIPSTKPCTTWAWVQTILVPNQRNPGPQLQMEKRVQASEEFWRRFLQREADSKDCRQQAAKHNCGKLCLKHWHCEL
jgi:hypothetical protein